MRIFFIIFMILANPVLAEKRVAFVVGNSNYQYAPNLDNPVRDATLISETLTDLDFEVTQLNDLTRDEIGRELTAFLERTDDADVTLFYFAGHGFQFEGRNYLVGTDAQLLTEFDIDGETLQLDKVVQILERNSRAALVFIDACRDNPLANQFYARNFSETRALATRGLAPINTPFQGTMITFSASPGEVAYDGEGQNSPFAAALARHLPTENLEVLSLMKRVIRDVKTATGDLQTPMVTNDLTKEIYLKLGTGGVGEALAIQQEQLLFEAASDLNSLRAWDIYLKRNPTGAMRDMALVARDALQIEEIASDAGVEVAELTPQTISRDLAIGIEADLGLSQDDNRAVQAALNRLGYKAGPEDGVMGRQTRQAVADFQAAVSLPITGVITDGTAQKLGLTLTRIETAGRPIISSRDARKYDLEKIALIESDPRLLKAARLLKGQEFVYGFYENRVYIALLKWCCISWEQAKNEAERIGGHLTTINSPAENRFVMSLIRHDDRMWQASSDGNWVTGPTFGFYQQDGGREPAGGWVWVTGEPTEYVNWVPGMPNNNFNRAYIGAFGYNGNRFDERENGLNKGGWDDSEGVSRTILVEIE